MDVHLLRSPELSAETYRNVLHLLQQFPGPVCFIESEVELDPDDTEVDHKTWREKRDFERQGEVFYQLVPGANLKVHAEPIEFPYTEVVKTWDQLFKICQNYRRSKNIAPNDLIVLLTDNANDMNWFGSVAPSMRDYFVHTANWHHYFGQNVDIRFPIAYEIAVWVQRHFMFSSREEIMQNIHHLPLGCINDFCEDKSQIVLKMRTADLCESCMEKLMDKDVPVLLCRQFFDILDGIRNNMTFRERSRLLHRPSRMEIRGRSKKIFFTDLGNLELRLNPKEKALYLLFLYHSDGINLNALGDHKQELKSLYSQFCNHGEQQPIIEAINLLVDPIDNDVNVVLSRIKRKLTNVVGESLLKFYCIDGERGGKKSIALDREMINIVD